MISRYRSCDLTHFQSDKAADELSFVSNNHDVAEERKFVLDAVLNWNWSHVLASSGDDQLWMRERFF